MKLTLSQALAENPIIAAVKDEAGLDRCLRCESIQVVFLLFGDICSRAGLVGRVQAAGKLAIVHADLITGLASKEIAVDYLHRATRADGIISTRQSFIHRARQLGLYAILRVFVVDSLGLSSLKKLTAPLPDYVDILPGTMPKTLRKICGMVPCPILAGGLIEDKEDVMLALDAGATAISTTKAEIWQL